MFIGVYVVLTGILVGLVLWTKRRIKRVAKIMVLTLHVGVLLLFLVTSSYNFLRMWRIRKGIEKFTLETSAQEVTQTIGAPNRVNSDPSGTLISKAVIRSVVVADLLLMKDPSLSDNKEFFPILRLLRVFAKECLLLTDDALQHLQNDGAPAQVIDYLEPLKYEAFCPENGTFSKTAQAHLDQQHELFGTEAEFWEALHERFGEELVAAYAPLIEKHAHLDIGTMLMDVYFPEIISVYIYEPGMIDFWYWEPSWSWLMYPVRGEFHLFGEVVTRGGMTFGFNARNRLVEVKERCVRDGEWIVHEVHDRHEP